jgi:hypothetical protein
MNTQKGSPRGSSGYTSRSSLGSSGLYSSGYPSASSARYTSSRPSARGSHLLSSSPMAGSPKPKPLSSTLDFKRDLESYVSPQVLRTRNVLGAVSIS